jgi:hypothetical protein
MLGVLVAAASLAAGAQERRVIEERPAITVPLPVPGVEVRRDRLERREVETTGRGGCDSKAVRKEDPEGSKTVTKERCDRRIDQCENKSARRPFDGRCFFKSRTLHKKTVHARLFAGHNAAFAYRRFADQLWPAQGSSCGFWANLLISGYLSLSVVVDAAPIRKVEESRLDWTSGKTPLATLKSGYYPETPDGRMEKHLPGRCFVDGPRVVVYNGERAGRDIHPK